MQNELNQIDEKLSDLNFKNYSSEWRYILLNLALKNKTIDDLKDIFGVSQTAINKWKRGEPISRDKKVFLAKMFGVTLDDFYQNIIADDVYNSLSYNLEKMININDYKKLSYNDLKKIYEAKKDLDDAVNYILTGNGKEKLEHNEFDYLCRNFNASFYCNGKTFMLNYENLMNEKNHILQDSNNLENLKNFGYKTTDLTKIVLLSENIKGIYLLLEPQDLKDILLKYEMISKEYEDFDNDTLVLEALLQKGALIEIDGKADPSATIELLNKYTKSKLIKKYDKEDGFDD